MVGTVVLSHYKSPIEGNVGLPFKLFGSKEEEGGGGGGGVVWCIFVLTMRPFCALG